MEVPSVLRLGDNASPMPSTYQIDAAYQSGPIMEGISVLKMTDLSTGKVLGCRRFAKTVFKTKKELQHLIEVSCNIRPVISQVMALRM